MVYGCRATNFKGLLVRKAETKTVQPETLKPLNSPDS